MAISGGISIGGRNISLIKEKNKGRIMSKFEFHKPTFRALLALVAWLITGYMMITGIPIVDAWWVIMTATSVFYFTSTQGSK